MRLVRALYTSRQTAEMTLDIVREISQVAQAKNYHDGVTGLLCYSNPYFAQCLEGSRTAVSRTLERIYRDPRHTDIVLIGFSEVDERVFADWSMKLVNLDEFTSQRVRAVCLRHGGTIPFRPSFLSEKQLLGFLRDLPVVEQVEAEYPRVQVSG